MTRDELDEILAREMPNAIEAIVDKSHFSSYAYTPLPGYAACVIVWTKGVADCTDMRIALTRAEGWRWAARYLHNLLVDSGHMYKVVLN